MTPNQLSKLQRVVRIAVEVIGGTSPRLDVLAGRFGVSPRTIWRDVAALRESGCFPVVQDGRIVSIDLIGMLTPHVYGCEPRPRYKPRWTPNPLDAK